MSLTSRIKSAGIKRHTARDGVTYILQRVNNANPFLQSGMLPAILGMIDKDEDPRNLTEQDILRRLAQDPDHAKEAIRLGEQAQYQKLEQGLVGEEQPDGKVLRYTWSDKSLFELQDGELNARLIPDDLREELTEVIDGLGRPAVEAQAITRFPEGGQSDRIGEVGQRDGHAPQRGPVGTSGAG